MSSDASARWWRGLAWSLLGSFAAGLVALGVMFTVHQLTDQMLRPLLMTARIDIIIGGVGLVGSLVGAAVCAANGWPVRWFALAAGSGPLLAGVAAVVFLRAEFSDISLSGPWH